MLSAASVFAVVPDEATCEAASFAGAFWLAAESPAACAVTFRLMQCCWSTWVSSSDPAKVDFARYKIQNRSRSEGVLTGLVCSWRTI